MTAACISIINLFTLTSDASGAQSNGDFILTSNTRQKLVQVIQSVIASMIFSGMICNRQMVTCGNFVLLQVVLNLVISKQ